jgi:hypothetical protein
MSWRGRGLEAEVRSSSHIEGQEFSIVLNRRLRKTLDAPRAGMTILLITVQDKGEPLRRAAPLVVGC